MTKALDQLTALLNPQQVCEVGTANWSGIPLQGPNGLQWVGAAGVVQQGHSNKGFETCSAPTISVHQETLLHMQDQGFDGLQWVCAGGAVSQGYGDKGPGSAHGPAQPPQALPIENSVLQMEPQIRVC